MSPTPVPRCLRWVFARHGDLRVRAMRGGVWLVLGAAVSRMTGLVKAAVLGRLLAPADFGLMGMALLVERSVTFFTEPGFNAALIQRSGDIKPYLDSAWTVQILRSIVFGLMFALAAPGVAAWFERPDIAVIIQVLAACFVVRGFNNPAVVYFRRNLEFDREVRWRSIAAITGLLVAVPLAYAYRNVWALVVSVAVAQVTETVMSYVVEPYRPRLRLESAKVRELFAFGKWIFWLNLVTFLTTYLDSFVVAKVLGDSALGLYQMAYLFALLPPAQLSAVMRGVMFPAFSQARQHPELRPVFLRILTLTTSLALPFGCFVTVFAYHVVLLILGPGWIASIELMQILAWAGIAVALTNVMTGFLQAVGHPDLPVRSLFANLAVLVVALYPAARLFGMRGVAVTTALASLLALGYQLALVRRTLRLSYHELFAAGRWGVVASTPILGAGIFVSHSSSGSDLVLALLALGVCTSVLVTTMPPYLRTSARSCGETT